MANEVIRIHDQFYILSTSGRIDDRTRVLKHGDMFAVFDRFGDIERFGSSELGLYYQDTRFLSRLALRLENQRPPLLSSTIREDNAVLTVDLRVAPRGRSNPGKDPCHRFRMGGPAGWRAGGSLRAA